MPIYCYSCTCGNKEERTLSIKDHKTEQKCNVCGKTLKREFPVGTGFILKGNWFKQGY